MAAREKDQTLHLADGGHLNYREAGEGSPVVLLHGFGLDLRLWDPQWAALSARHRTIRYDFRGFGASSLPAGAYSHVDDFGALIQCLGVSPVHLVGLSMGGGHALRIASKMPQALRSLTLVDSALDGHAWSEGWKQRWRTIAGAAKTDVAEAKRLWLEHELFAPARADASAAAALKAMVDRYSGWHFTHRDPDSNAPATAQALPGIAVPTLVILGERDIEDFQVIAHRLASEMPEASLQILSGVGHMANLEDPAAFNQGLLEHLAASESAD